MASKKKFEDCFWVNDFCSTRGFDVLDKRLKEGSDMIKDVIEHLKQRIKIEEEYSKSLIKLARSTSGCSEIGTMRQAWDCLKSETEKIAQEHKTLSNSLSQQAAALTKLRENQKISRKLAKEQVEKNAKRKAEYFTKLMEQRKAYENKCQELQDCISKVEACKQSRNTEKTHQLLAKQERIHQDVKKTDELYQKLVHQLEDIRKEWEKEMINFCQCAQSLEKERLEYLRDQLWITVNHISQTCVEDDEHCEMIRKSLELCDSNADISLFIRNKATGSNRPPAILYVRNKYYSLITNQ